MEQLDRTQPASRGQARRRPGRHRRGHVDAGFTARAGRDFSWHRAGCRCHAGRPGSSELHPLCEQTRGQSAVDSRAAERG